MITTIHCCVCSRVCGHVGGPWFCADHKSPPAAVDSDATALRVRAERLREAYDLKVQDLARETARTSRLTAERDEALAECESLRSQLAAVTAERDEARKKHLLIAARALLAEAKAYEEKWLRSPRRPDTTDWDKGYVRGMESAAHTVANSIERPLPEETP